MSNLTRVQMLLEPKQHEALKRIAKERGTSVAEVTREAIQQWMENSEREGLLRQQAKAWRSALDFGEELIRQRGGQPFEVDVVADLNAMREERLERIAPGRP